LIITMMRWWIAFANGVPRTLFPLFLLLLPLTSGAQTIYSRFMKHWEGGDVEYGYGAVQAPDGDFVITGYLGTGASFYDACVMKLDPGGSPVWIQSYGGPDVESAFGVRVMRDGGLAVAANTVSVGHGLMDMLVMKTDILGNVLWSRAIGGAGEDMATAIDTTQDGGLVVCGYTNSFGAGNTDVYIVKLDAVGNVQWTRVVGGPTAETAYDVVATVDGGYAVSGQTVSFGAGLTDYFLVRLNAAGTVLYSRTYGTPSHDFGYRFCATADDHLVLAGYTGPVGSSDGMLVKVTAASGALVWVRTYGSPSMDRIFDVLQTRDGNYVGTGEGTTSTFGAGDQQVLKVSPAGNLLWARHYGTPFDETGYGVGLETRDHGLMVVGWDDSAEDVFVNKMDSMGDSGCNNAPIALTVGTPALSVGTGGLSTTGGTGMNVVIPFALVGMTEVPYCSVVLPEGEVRLMGEAFANEGNRLTWEIAAPGQFAWVALQRSGDGERFRSLDFREVVAAAGEYWDRAVEGAQYYRLALQDWDGGIAYSEVIRLGGAGEGQLLRFLQANGQVEGRQFRGLSVHLPLEWLLVDGQGRVVAQGGGAAESGQPSDPIVFEGVNAGVYVWRVRQAGKEWAEKVVLLR
jgi:hypothetical protein